MLTKIKILTGGCALALFFAVAPQLLGAFSPSTCPTGHRIELPKPLAEFQGFAFIAAGAELSKDGDGADDNNRSRLILCEGDTKLGPAHTQHFDIARLGAGRFSHYEGLIVFSASDNTDPRTNGRTYTAILP